MEIELTTAERIRAVQNQLRIAIQNHQLLYMRRRSCPSDPDIQNHMNVIQGLIISMGRTQAELMSRFRQEIAQQYDTKSSNVCITNIISKHLTWTDVPKAIPVYKNVLNKKKLGPWSQKLPKRESLLRKTNKLQSLLKINNEKGDLSKKENEKDTIYFDNSKIKIVYNKSNNEEKSILRTKKLQSVLKPKNLMKAEENFKSDNVNCLDEKNSTIEISSEPNSPISSNSDVKYKEILSPSDSPSDEAEYADVIPVKNAKIADSRTEKKIEAKLNTKKKDKSLGNCDKKERKADLESRYNKYESRYNKYESTILLRSNGYINNNRFVKQEPKNYESLNEISQETFLSFFGLVSKSQYDILKRKRCERKRRSVAGQSSLYSDYFQPSTPKRSYGPRKSTSIPTSPNNQVIVEIAAEIDDDDEKPLKNRFCCTICNESGDSVETCPSCSEVYHPTCTSSPTAGCPNCSAEPSNIKSIVGANFASSASSSEVIKRYLNGEI